MSIVPKTPIFGRCLAELRPEEVAEDMRPEEPEPTIELNYRGKRCFVTYSLLYNLVIEGFGVDAVELKDWLGEVRKQMAEDARPAADRAAERLRRMP